MQFRGINVARASTAVDDDEAHVEDSAFPSRRQCIRLHALRRRVERGKIARENLHISRDASRKSAARRRTTHVYSVLEAAAKSSGNTPD